MNCDSRCIHYQDMLKLKTNSLLWWSTTPHPCTVCRRFPRTQTEMPDNYSTREGVSGDGQSIPSSEDK